ncbi:efflux RND transporter permease subunit [Zongyangia hominis]|uniref:Efflux RND transporter permease subunit n=1 Tax=Zongyangia hominis TaxID=2763677 RepID=A0A926ECZ5_9FIRM|nr:efflux RND transporter permease subunit [Zongyangia hominis]MBC8569487.1 efflux RND transporter permease subunit [Zongyangia hominis]
MNLTKISLKRPVAVLICVLALVIFGVSAIFNTPMELTPPMEFPMFIINTVYPGAGPEEVEDLVTSKIEAAVGTVSGLKNIQSTSQENVSMVMLELEYGTNMDLAHMDLQEKLNMYVNSLPDTATTPVIFELSMDMVDTITLSAKATGDANVLHLVEDEVVPELEKLTGVASVDVSGGQTDYIRVQLREESLSQYNLDMSSVVSVISASNFSIPAGDIGHGDQSLILRGGVEYNTVEALRSIPITLRTGDIIHLSDIADISEATKSSGSISRYNGEENITIGVKKRQSASTLDVTEGVTQTMQKLNDQNIGVEMNVISDTGENIKSSINSVVNALLLGCVISVLVLFFFLGDIKASLIVATSMPLSVLATLVLMNLWGMSLNLVSLGGLVVGVGMMVDNSIVVLESCFRSRDEQRSFRESAIVGAKLVATSVIASTITTIVVFLPISVMKGLSGQIFSQAGFTIMFALIASLISSLTLVPLLFYKLKPVEKKDTVITRWLSRVEAGYGRLIRKSFDHKKLVVLAAVGLLVFSIALIPLIGMELMPEMDQGVISISVEAKPGLKLTELDKTIQKIEQEINAQPDVENYSVTTGGSMFSSSSGGSASFSVYLKGDREMETYEVADVLREKTKNLTGCDVKVSQMSAMTLGGNSDVEVNLIGKDQEQLEAASQQVKDLMSGNPDIVAVSSSLSDGNPQAEIIVDPVKSTAAGFMPAQVVSTVSSIMQGKEATTIRQNSKEYEVWVEYPEGRYEDVSDLSGVVLLSQTGKQVPLMDVASIRYSNSPQVVQRYNNQYIVTITGQPSSQASTKLSSEITSAVSKLELPDGVSQFMGGDIETMQEEFNGLYGALATAVLLVFMVMAVEFESIRNSLIVMLSVPFSMIGAFLGLLISGAAISMPSLIGFVELVGIVVNNAIVLVDYTKILRTEDGMEIHEALIKAGSTRLRPILMTTLTTVLSLLPMALGIGGDVEMMQSMAYVIIGGLTSSTLLTLVLIPVLYLLFAKKEKYKPLAPGAAGPIAIPGQQGPMTEI